MWRGWGGGRAGTQDKMGRKSLPEVGKDGVGLAGLPRWQGVAQIGKIIQHSMVFCNQKMRRGGSNKNMVGAVLKGMGNGKVGHPFLVNVTKF